MISNRKEFECLYKGRNKDESQTPPSHGRNRVVSHSNGNGVVAEYSSSSSSQGEDVESSGKSRKKLGSQQASIRSKGDQALKDKVNRILKEKQARNQNNSERINNYRSKQQSVDAKATRAKEGASGKSDAVRNQTSTNLLS